jgi:uncharacterized protein YutE (UPF0331/DUF86 family)/predicted nucleotidyltransferase
MSLDNIENGASLNKTSERVKPILKKASRAVANVEGVDLAVLFGAAAKEGSSSHDVDIAIWLAEGADRLRTLSNVVLSVSRALGVLEDKVDVVDLDRAGIDLKKEIVESGLVLCDKNDRWERLVGEVTANHPAYSELRSLSIREWLSSSDPSSINVGVVKRRLEFMKVEMDFLKGRVLSHNPGEVQESPELRRLLERGFQLVVEAMLDVCRHIVSAKGWGPAYVYADYIERMKEKGVLTEEMSSKLVRFIAIRNIIVHRYLDVDYGGLYSEAMELERSGREFEVRIANLLKQG